MTASQENSAPRS